MRFYSRPQGNQTIRFERECRSLISTVWYKWEIILYTQSHMHINNSTVSSRLRADGLWYAV